MLKRALSAFRGDGRLHRGGAALAWLACRAAMKLWDDESWDVLCHPPGPARPRRRRAHACFRSRSTSHAGMHIFAGEFAAAAALRRRGATRSPRRPGASRRPTARWSSPPGAAAKRERHELIEASDQDAIAAARAGRSASPTRRAAVLYNGLGRYGTRSPRPQRPASTREELVFSTWALARAGRGGRPEREARASRPTRSSGSRRRRAPAAPTGRWGSRRARGRCSATATAAEGLYREAIERLGRTRVRA